MNARCRTEQRKEGGRGGISFEESDEDDQHYDEGEEEVYRACFWCMSESPL